MRGGARARDGRAGRRPRTLLDGLQQETTWFHPALGRRSLWRDGFVPPPGKENATDLTWGVAALGPDAPTRRADGVQRGAPPESRRSAMPSVAAAVDALQREHRRMFRPTMCAPPHVEASVLVLDVLRSDWLGAQGPVSPEGVLAFLRAQNNALAAWTDAMWADEGLSFQALTKVAPA